MPIPPYEGIYTATTGVQSEIYSSAVSYSESGDIRNEKVMKLIRVYLSFFYRWSGLELR